MKERPLKLKAQNIDAVDYKQIRAWAVTHKIVAVHAANNDLEMAPALDDLVRLGLSAKRKTRTGAKKE